MCSRLDLAYVVNAVNGYTTKTKKENWKVVQWIMRYLRGSNSVCLKFGRIRDRVARYVDYDYAGDLDKRRSLTGYVFTIGECVVSWKVTLQSIASLLTTKAKYMTVAEAYKDTLWLKGLFGELSDQLQVSTLFCDSQSAIFLTKD